MHIGDSAGADAKNNKPTGSCAKRANQVGLLINGLFAFRFPETGVKPDGGGAGCPLIHLPMRNVFL